MLRHNCVDCARKHLAQALVNMLEDRKRGFPRKMGDDTRPVSLSAIVHGHLTQALVLMLEVEKGYPIHKWIAVGHLAEAEDVLVRATVVSLADNVRQFRLRYMASNDSTSRIHEINNLVSGLCISLLTSKPPPHTEHMYAMMAIAHMAEAEDEILCTYPEVAERIHLHRLTYTHDSGYNPPMVELIEAVSALTPTDTVTELELPDDDSP